MSPALNSRPAKATVAGLLLALLPFAGSVAGAAEHATGSLANEIVVSDRDFNHFVFPSPIINGPVFPAGSAISGQPIYLADNRQLLLQLVKGEDAPINMVVELENGSVHKFWLIPKPVAGITRRVDGASERRVSAVPAPAQGDGNAPRGAEIELLKAVVTGAIPEDFDAADLPAPTRFDKFTVIPLSGWTDGMSRRVTMYSLVAAPGQTAVVAPPQFYRTGVLAISLDGDVVDVTSSPVLYVVEEAYEND